MNTDDEAFERLHAADPGATASADLDRIRGAVDARVAETARRGLGPDGAHRVGDADPGAGAAPPATGGAAVAAIEARGSSDSTTGGPRRRGPSGARWLQVAAASVGVLAVGAGAFALGSSQAGDPVPTASRAPGAVSLSGAAGGPSVAAESSGARRADTAVGQASALSLPYGFFGGRTVFHAQGLSGDGGWAEAWAFDAGIEFSAESVERVARALGLQGSAVRDGGSWLVGSADWTGPAVRLENDGLARFSFNDPTLQQWQCPAAAPGSAAGTSAEAIEPVAPQPCIERDLGTPPEGDAAVAQLRGVIEAAGLDPADFEFDVQSFGDATATYVSAQRLVGGLGTGLTWNVTLTGSGVQSADGFLAPLVEFGAYDVISPVDAVARLNDPRFGATGGATLYAADAARAVPDVVVPGSGGEVIEPDAAVAVPLPGDAGGSSASAPAALPGTGDRISWPVRQATITSARLGLTVHHQASGAVLLLPAYELAETSGGTWGVLAVTDAGLDFAAPSS